MEKKETKEKEVKKEETKKEKKDDKTKTTNNKKNKEKNEKEEEKFEDVEINIKIDKEIYSIYKLFFDQYKEKNKDLSDEEIHGKIFTYMFKEVFIDEL